MNKREPTRLLFVFQYLIASIPNANDIIICLILLNNTASYNIVPFIHNN